MNDKNLRIAIAVHGRFHAFDLARALLGRGHDVVVLTHYPRRIVERFGFPGERVRSLVLHGVLSRAARKLQAAAGLPYPEAGLQRMFGRWVARALADDEWDVAHLWSGVAEEGLQALAGRRRTFRWLMRGSAHIRTQARLLAEEEARTGAPQQRPSDWMVAREEREYAQADSIRLLSSFARRTFVEEGVPAAKLLVNALGVEVATFRPEAEVVERRCRRILIGDPLRVLFVGSCSFQKGLWDSARIVETLQDEAFSFRFVGPQPAETAALRAELAGRAEFVPKQPQAALPGWYARSDLFLFPTIHDGFAVVLAQANAACLPILTTNHCSGPDWIRDGETGWILPIRCPEAFVERLRWCHTHRRELAAMVKRIHSDFSPPTWEDTAAEFETLALERLADKHGMANKPRERAEQL